MCPLHLTQKDFLETVLTMLMHDVRMIGATVLNVVEQLSRSRSGCIALAQFGMHHWILPMTHLQCSVDFDAELEGSTSTRILFFMSVFQESAAVLARDGFVDRILGVSPITGCAVMRTLGAPLPCHCAVPAHTCAGSA